MKQVKEIQSNYNNKLTELKYNYAVDLLNLITDDEYMNLLEDKKELLNPISGPEGDEYLHNDEVLDQIIKTFIETIENRTPDPEEMDLNEVKEYLNSLLTDLDVERLRSITKVVQTMLGLK